MKTDSTKTHGECETCYPGWYKTSESGIITC